MQHINALEHVCDQIYYSLKPEGKLVLNEYGGPSRFQFPSRDKDLTNLCLRLIPPQYRTTKQPNRSSQNLNHRRSTPIWKLKRLGDKIQDGDLGNYILHKIRQYTSANFGYTRKDKIFFPSPKDMIRYEPTMAIRSGDIMKIIQDHFDIIEKKIGAEIYFSI